MTLCVLKPGLQTTLQDRGRFGHAALGVGASGAMDDVALRLANALVGNAVSAAALEMTLIGPQLRVDGDVTFALTGSAIEVRMGQAGNAGTRVPMWQPFCARAGNVLHCGAIARGARSYLAVAGGFAAKPVLGSVATDINGHLGPYGGRALVAGDVLAIGATGPESDSCKRHDSTRSNSASQAWSLDPRPWYPDPERPVWLLRGSHFDALDHASQRRLFDAEFRIAAESNRVGLRLEGPPLRLSAPLELISEPVASGTVQLPPDGQAIVLMAEHPTTGGYPRIGQLAAVDLPHLGQRRPGETLRFAPIELDQAQTRYLARERELALLIETIANRLAG